MKTNLVILFILLGIIAYAQQLAFPTAEGYGKYTKGGRGGAVYEVTNLNDSGEGSLRAAVEASGARTVVFRISGTINLSRDLKISNPYITIAGQTAPGAGICVRNYPIVINADEVIIRFIRVRMGDEAGNESDAISGRYHKNIILDHVSASWSVDETVSIYHCENVTVQWCIVSESLYLSNHEKGTHGYGAIWGSNYSTYHHNLLAHHTSRNPRFASGCGYTDYRNNVIYNWGYNSCYGAEKQQVGNENFSSATINMVANYYKSGPATKSGSVKYKIAQPSSRDKQNDYGKWFVAGNYVHGYDKVTADNWDGGIQPDDGSTVIDRLKLTEPWDAMEIIPETAEEAYVSVLHKAGASFPNRDIIDRRIVNETNNGTATFGSSYGAKSGIIDTQDDVGGWPELESLPAPLDTDHDGIPDDWENKNETDPNDAADRNDINSEGYTILEQYLNSIIKFETGPSIPLYTYPEDNSTFENIENIELSWKASIGANSYNVYFGQNENNLTLIAENTDITVYTVNELEAANYYWQIEAVNDTTAAKGAVWSFTVEKDVSIKNIFEYNSKLAVIYPNPVKNHLFLNADSKGKAIIYNNLGVVVLIVDLNKAENTIDVHNLSTGIHYVKTNCKGSVSICQFIKE